MAKILKIDLDKYCTQADYARETDTKLATVSQWVKRAKEGKGTKKVDYLEVAELGLTLVARPR